MPVQELDLGYTGLNQSLFHDFLNDIADRFSPSKYNLLKHNCNNFSDECMQFLIGRPIPKCYVLNFEISLIFISNHCNLLLLRQV